MMLTSWLQWNSFKKLKKMQNSQRRRHLYITCAFGFSFLIRAVFNTFQVARPDDIRALK
jgi:hypothetical protein